MRLIRLFLSSPRVAAVERRRTESIVSRLDGEFAGRARLETMCWETEFYWADATFQTQIPRSAECDIVVGILRWRLGTAFRRTSPGCRTAEPNPAPRPASF